MEQSEGAAEGFPQQLRAPSLPNSENALRRGRFHVNASLSNSQASLPSIPTYEWHALGDDRRRLPLHHLACREARRRERAMTMPAPEATSTARAACGRGVSPVFAKPADPGSPSAEGTGSSVTVTHAVPSFSEIATWAARSEETSAPKASLPSE